MIQAREILGDSFPRKVRRARESRAELQGFVLETVRGLLPKTLRTATEETGYAILNASEEFKLDPVFLMAVIQNESSFDPRKRGAAGEVGLMQVRPRTAGWIAGMYGLEYDGVESLEHPSINIWIGAALLAHLRQEFDSRGHLYLSAYNVGSGKLKQLISRNTPPKSYVRQVVRRYHALYEGYRSGGDVKVLSQAAVSKVLEITN